MLRFPVSLISPVFGDISWSAGLRMAPGPQWSTRVYVIVVLTSQFPHHADVVTRLEEMCHE